MKSLFACLFLTVLVTACNSNGDSTPRMFPVNELLENESFSFSNQERFYHLYLPGEPRSASIVLILHGNGGSHDQVLGLERTKAPHKVWLDIAQQENTILIVPNGNFGPEGRRGWNDCRSDAPSNPDSDDVRYISELVEFVQNRYGSTTSSVFAVGTSNGGHMSMRLADEAADLMDAMAVIVAARPANSECMESAMPMSVLIMNGTNDPILPYGGGQIGSNRGEVLSTAETVNYWINRNQSNTTPTVINVPDTDLDDDSTINRFSYTSSVNNTAVEHYEVINGGHTEPSIAQRYSNLFKLIVGNQNHDIEMAREIWEFFRSQ